MIALHESHISMRKEPNEAEIGSKRNRSVNVQNEKEAHQGLFHRLPELAAWRIDLFFGGVKVYGVKALIDEIISFPCRCLSVAMEFDRKDLDQDTEQLCEMVGKALQKRPVMCFDITLSWSGRLDDKGLMRRLARSLLLSPQVVALALRPSDDIFVNVANLFDSLPESTNRAHIFRLGMRGLEDVKSQKQAASLIAKILRHDKKLLYLNVSETGLDLSHRVLLDVNFYRSLEASSLCYLRLREAGLKSSACVSIAALLAGHGTLQLIDLSFNRLGDRGVVAIAESLISNTTLRFLGLTSVGITKESGCALARVLRENQTLEMCYLKDDDLGADTGKAFALMLGQNVSLKYLVMSYSNLEREGCKAFIPALKQNQTLTHLRLNFSGISLVDKSELVRVAVEGETLQVLEFEDKNELGPFSPPYLPYNIYLFEEVYRRHLLASIDN